MSAAERRRTPRRGLGYISGQRLAARLAGLLATACLLSTAAAGALPPVFKSIGRYPYSITASLSGLQYALYNIETPPDATTGMVPDLFITLNSGNPASRTSAADPVDSSPITSTADIYCNPMWVTVEGRNSVAQPGDALFYSEGDVGINDIYISADDPVIRPPGLRNNNTADYAKFVPTYNCTVVNNDPSAAVHYTLTVAPSFTDITLAPNEQTIINHIWTQCCQGSITQADIANANASEGTTFDIGPYNASDQNPLLVDTCGTWLLFNNLFGVTPFVDFCKVTGNVCNEEGHLTTLNFNQWNLACPFPADDIGQLEFVENLIMSNNFNLTGNMSVAFEALASMGALVNVDFTNNYNLKGSWTGNTTYSTQAPICKLAASGLATLSIAATGITDSEFPPCLLGPFSTLEELHIEVNNLTGIIPDNFDSTSHLRVFVAWNNALTGPIPATLSTVPNLEEVDFGYNSMSGTIPEGLGSPQKLRFLYLQNNNFTGAIPETLALHPALQALDVSYNGLTAMPQDWYATSLPAIATSPLVNLNLAFNSFEGLVPQALAHLPNLEILMLQNAGLSPHKIDCDHSAIVTGTSTMLRSGPLLTQTNGFPALRWLNISSNAFTGALPSTYGSSGIFTLGPVEFANVALFEELSRVAETENVNAVTSAGYVYGQVFDVSNNSFTGPVPSFLYANNVPPWTQPTVYIQDNQLDVDCNNVPVQLQYIVDDHGSDATVALCPQNVTSAEIAAGANAPGINAPAAGPDGAASATASAPAAATESSSSGGGLSSGAKAGVAVGVILFVAALAAAGFLWHRRRSRDSAPALPAMPKWASAPSSLVGSARSRFSASPRPATPTPTGFSKFSDLEMTSGMDRGPQPASLNFNAQMGGGGHSNGFHA